MTLARSEVRSAQSAWRSVAVDALTRAGWAPVSLFLAHVFASHVVAGYERFPRLDVPMHVAGGVAIAFFLGRVYRGAESDALLGRPARWVYFPVVLALATSTTVVWELAEFVSDRYAGTHAQGGLEDTLKDMTMGALGASAFLVVAWFRDRRSGA